MIEEWNISHVLSVITLDLLNSIKLPDNFDKNNWIVIDMDDIIHVDAPNAPTKEQVFTILKWGASLPTDAKVLVHCFAGVSRSTACALALKVQDHGLDKLDKCIKWLVKHRPNACPNPVITWHADSLLAANGQLFQKAEEIANARIAQALEE